MGLLVKITTFTSMPSNITIDDMNKERDFANVESVVDVTYDEAGAAAGGAVAGVAVGAGESAVGGGQWAVYKAGRYLGAGNQAIY